MIFNVYNYVTLISVGVQYLYLSPGRPQFLRIPSQPFYMSAPRSLWDSLWGTDLFQPSLPHCEVWQHVRYTPWSLPRGWEGASVCLMPPPMSSISVYLPFLYAWLNAHLPALFLSVSQTYTHKWTHTQVLKHARLHVCALLFPLHQTCKALCECPPTTILSLSLFTHTQPPPHLVLLSGKTPGTIVCSFSAYGQRGIDVGHLEGIRLD